MSESKAVVAPKPILRARAGDTLARLGDPRFDSQRFYLPAADGLGFARIPADPEFVIGTRKAAAKRIAEIIGAEVPDHELNDTRTPTPDGSSSSQKAQFGFRSLFMFEKLMMP